MGQTSKFNFQTSYSNYTRQYLHLNIFKQPASPSKRVYSLWACFIWILAKRRQRQRRKSLIQNAFKLNFLWRSYVFFFFLGVIESLYKVFNFVFSAVRPYAWRKSSYNLVPPKNLQNQRVEINATNLYRSYISPLLNENKILIKLVASEENSFNF